MTILCETVTLEQSERGWGGKVLGCEKAHAGAVLSLCG